MPGRILLIEDEPSIADNVAYALKTEGMEPVCCGTGEEGLAALAAGRVDLVILDVGLPDTSGFDLCREIRKTSSVPVIFLTARADEIDRVVGLEIGADDYVVKPFSPRELTARVKAVLRRAGAPPATGAPAPLAHGPFVVDRARCRVTYHDTALDLSRTEYRLLAVFVERPGWVFSREQLMERAWDEPEASLDRTVDAHVKSLRRKLRAVRPGDDPILTHRGLGYALREEP
jgi:two-component system catabolic regulation response regulator CreB